MSFFKFPALISEECERRMVSRRNKLSHMSGCRAASSFVLSCGGGKKNILEEQLYLSEQQPQSLMTTLTHFSYSKGVSNRTCSCVQYSVFYCYALQLLCKKCTMVYYVTQKVLHALHSNFLLVNCFIFYFTK